MSDHGMRRMRRCRRDGKKPKGGECYLYDDQSERAEAGERGDVINAQGGSFITFARP